MGRDNDSLRGGQYGDQNPVRGEGARFSALVHTGPAAHPASCTMGTGSFSGVKRPRRGVDHQPVPRAELKERVDHLHSVLAFMACSRVNVIGFLQFSTEALDRSKWLASRPSHFNPNAHRKRG